MSGAFAVPDMGAHAVFVWSAFALTLVVLAGLWAASTLALRNREALLARLRAAGGDDRAEGGP